MSPAQRGRLVSPPWRLSVPASPCTFPGWAQSGKVTCRPPSLSAGKLVHSMVAHLDAVTCLAVDPNGVFLMSGSKSGASWPLRSEGACPSRQERERSARGLPEAGLLVGVLSEQGSGAPLWLVRVVTGVGSLEPR